jgi:hypothetical protein
VLVGKLDLPAELLCELLGYEGRPESIERHLLAVGYGCHQAKVIPQGVPLGQRAQALPAAREKARRVGQSDARDGRCRKRLNLGGI